MSRDMEEFFAEKRKKVQSVKPPGDLEARLKKALPEENRFIHRVFRLQVLIVLMVVMVSIYHFDSLAYYGQRLQDMSR